MSSISVVELFITNDGVIIPAQNQLNSTKEILWLVNGFPKQTLLGIVM